MSRYLPTYPNRDAFPSKYIDSQDEVGGEDGLTKREYFAGLALQGLLANAASLEDFETYHELGEAAVEAADALITALNKDGAA